MTEILENVFNEPPFTGISVVPENKPLQKMIVLLHGYQGDALSNLSFGRNLAYNIPGAAVIIPDGLDRVPTQTNQSIRQWWNLKLFDGKTGSYFTCYAKPEEQIPIKEMAWEANETAKLLNEFILNQLKKYSLSVAKCYVVGISQGAMTAFDMVLFRDELASLGGMVSIGAGMLYPDRIKEKKHSSTSTRFLLARGKYDEIFPRTVDYFTASLLREHGFSVDEVEVDSSHYGLEHNVLNEVVCFLNQK